MQLDHGYVEQGREAVCEGPAAVLLPDPHVLALATARPDFLRGLFAGLLLRADCVRVSHDRWSTGGLVAGHAWFSSADGAGTVAAHLKRDAFRRIVNPVVRDLAFDVRFQAGTPPGGWDLPLPPEVPPDRFTRSGDRRWATGPAWSPDASPSRRKLCVSTTDPQRLEQVLAAVASHPTCLGVRTTWGPDHESVCGRAAFVDDDAAGWMARRVASSCPDVHPVVQDDRWFAQFRQPTE